MNKIIVNNGTKGLIFDCDGTLDDSMPLHMKAWEEAFQVLEDKTVPCSLLSISQLLVNGRRNL